MPKRLVLASTSPYRIELLGRLGVAFETVAPAVNETALPGELPLDTARRLAEAKARSVAARFADALIIGSDQVAEQGGQAFGKPGSRERNVAQLRELSGREVAFHSGLCLLNAATANCQCRVVTTEVGFRPLDDDEIRRYVEREDASNCAGGARAEALGITLLRHIRGDDPNALIGLPLIALCEMLRNEGVALP